MTKNVTFLRKYSTEEACFSSNSKPDENHGEVLPRYYLRRYVFSGLTSTTTQHCVTRRKRGIHDDHTVSCVKQVFTPTGFLQGFPEILESYIHMFPRYYIPSVSRREKTE